MTTLNVVAAVAAVNNITLYLEDGGTKELKTDEYRTVDIINKVLPRAALGKITKIKLKEYGIQKDFEESTNNTITFYVVSKELTKSIFNSDIKKSKLTAAKAAKIGTKNFDNMDENIETIVAIVDGKVIPGMENIEAQLEHANKNNSIGMVNFLTRISKVIDKRGHSIEDLLAFLRKGDLPIAEDGSVVAYKALRREGDYYVDCHSGNVKQKVGDYVFMKEEMVDANNRKSCSNGLHIARRDYLSGFSGDVIVICKIAPEAFIAVPVDDTSKVRVSGYHILAELSKEARQLLMNNTPMTSKHKSAVLLTNILEGNHINIVNRVEITGQYGAGLITTKVDDVKEPKIKKTKKTKAIRTEKVVKKAKEKIKTISPKALREKMNQIIKADSTPNELQAQAIALFRLGKNKTEIAKTLGSSTRTIGRWFDKFPHLLEVETEPEPKAKTKVKAKAAKDWEPDAPKPKAKPKAKAKKAVTKVYGDTPEQQRAFKALSKGATKAQVAKEVGTSTRTLGRWIDKFNFPMPT